MCFPDSSAYANGPSLPTEILTLIIESFILLYSFTRRNNSSFAESVRFTPRWYLIPLLRVSKLWHAIAVKYLYQSIAVGSHAPFRFPTGDIRYDDHSWCMKRGIPANQRSRMGHEVAGDLYRTLETKPSLAALITTLQLGVEAIYRQKYEEIVAGGPRIAGPRIARFRTIDISHVDSSWTKTHSRILQLCPNVKHVDIRGFHRLQLHALLNELGKKSLVYFSISAHGLSKDKWVERLGKPAGHFSQILGLMQKWPKLRGIRVEEFLDVNMTEDPVTLDASQVSGCCPSLQEIIITGAVLRPDMYKALRVLCNRGITKLASSLHNLQAGTRGGESIDALCECLQLWSPTLEYFKVDIMNPNGCDSYQPLSDAIHTLGELRGLHVDRMKLDLGVVSRLPRLECLAYLPPYHLRKEEGQALSIHLEDADKFPSLKLIEDDKLSIDDGFKEVCKKRNIRLSSQWKGGRFSDSFHL